MSYLIIGNSTAAIGAVEGIRKYDKKTAVTIVSEEPYHTYSRPLISYYLSGKVTEEKMAYRDRDFYEKNGVQAILGIKAVSVDTSGKTVLLENGKSINFTKLLIATGSKPFVPKIEGLHKRNVFGFGKFDDVKGIKKVAAKGKRAVVVGASFSGLKAVEALVQLGIRVTVIDIMDRILPRVLDEDAASIVMKTLTDSGVNVLLNNTVQEIYGEEEATGVILKDGRFLPCDFVVLAIGIRCNTDLVKDTEILMNRGIIVNERMQTNIPDIFAAGDVAEGYNLIEDRNMEIPILPNAYRQGETAGINMAGKHSIFSGGLVMNSMPLLGLTIMSAGVSEEKENIRVKKIRMPTRNSYKKFYIRGNNLVGFLLVNDIDRGGIYTGLIRGKVDISSFEDVLGSESFGLISFPKELRKEYMLEEVVQHGQDAKCQGHTLPRIE